MIRKERLVNFRVTEEQYHLLRQKAAAAGVSVSEYVRDVVIKDAETASLHARMERVEALLKAAGL